MSSVMQDFKKQASFFLREKIKTARLVLMDVTPAQILTEEVTNGDLLAPDVHAMRLISKAAFDVDDYERIVQILHQRLSKFDAPNWRGAYKALVLLEHLLTHGPQRIAEEFEIDTYVIKEMESFHYLDNKGFNWGLSVKNKSERVLELLEDKSYLKEERIRARKLIVGIKGFGSVSQRFPNVGEKSTGERMILRSKTEIGYCYHEEKNDILESDEKVANTKVLVKNKMGETSLEDLIDVKDMDHPFWNGEHHTRVSLLSSV